ncbi:hypothetical protein [Halodesulfovibrio marinisediminis]|uniref:Uncharacterized protein n=1 Tax=Halodesulfovibrio marinisediminis DSM 17456 TaxID=1121457 RepID=A0A1N6H6M5_9BACT|nr:hypothetical protein [Halodesulfovibrio marinisediminis]SIO15434.1 hypothetical protein SAMN02745161_2037 [Halodesulfovibrio marinisediminis DSM 17456]
MTSKRKLLLITVILLGSAMLIDSFLLIDHNKKLAVEMLEDVNKRAISVNCEKVDAGVLSIKYSGLSIQPKGSNNPHETITIDSMTIAKLPSLTMLISRDMKQGKTSINCNGVTVPLNQSMSKEYGAGALKLNFAASSDINDRDVMTAATIDIPEVGSITSDISLDVDPKLYELNDKIDQRTLIRFIALKGFKFTLKNNGGVQELLTAAHIQKATITKAERDIHKISAVDYQADLNSFIDGSKKLSLDFSFPDNKSVPLNQLFLAMLFRSPDDPSKIKITSF